MTITELAIKRPTLIIVLFTVLGVLGVYGFSKLKYDLMPKMSAPVLIITTTYPGASPSEVENSVSKVIEDAIVGIEKVVTVRTSSYESFSFIFVELEQNADINIALEDAQRKINAASEKFPVTARKPVISKIAFDEIPVIRMAARSSMPTKEFYQFVKDRIHPRLSKMEGVGMVSMIG